MNFLTGLAFWQIIILLLIIIIAIFGLVFFIVFLVHKFKISIKTKFGEVNHSDKNDKEELEELKSLNKLEIITLEKREFIQIINRIKSSMEKIANIEKIDKLEKQMKFAEETILSLNLKTEKNFLELLRSKKDFKNIVSDTKNFSGLIRISYDKILEILKEAFKTNSFEKKTDRDFEDYLDRKFAVIAKSMKDTQNDYLTPFNEISETEFSDFIQTHSEEQKRTIINIFKNAQVEFSKAKEEIFKEDMALDEFIWSLVDVKKGD